MLAAPAYAQVQGQDYQLLTPPQPTATPDKVEVIEFFSYGCPHCYALQPQVVKWAAELPANVSVHPRPGVVRQARVGPAEPRVLRARSDG